VTAGRRDLFEKHARDLAMDLRFSTKFCVYYSRQTNSAWRLWNLALAVRDAVPEVEPPVEVTLSDVVSAEIHFNWGQEMCGNGDLRMTKGADGSIICSNDNMSRRWVRRAMHAAVDTIVDGAVLKD
jgi:hypothetical protein